VPSFLSSCVLPANAAIGIYFTWRGQRITREGLEKTQQNTQEQLQLTRANLESTQKDTEQQLRLTQQGQLTERFTRAIDQLGALDDTGAKSLEVRLGGIYALERIAGDSRSYHWPIMEVLTAYVRQHASSSAFQERVWHEESRRQNRAPERPIDREEVEEVDASFINPELDIQAIMTVIGRRTRHPGYEEPAQLDLRHVALPNADLRGVNLQGALLYGADLRKANLYGANLRDADLEETNLHSARLEEANLRRANLHGANLLRAGLREADLHKANLYKANLQEAELVKASLWEANLQEAELEEANLWDANLEGANRIPQDQLEETMGSSKTVVDRESWVEDPILRPTGRLDSPVVGPPVSPVIFEWAERRRVIRGRAA
jgi:uncharacterized protein YjbI with pentapeptide repeats